MVVVPPFARPLLVVAVALTAPGVRAETVVHDVTVTASVATECTVPGTALNFGGYDPRDGADNTTTTRIRVECTAEGDRVTIRLGGGAHADSSGRRMSDGRGNFLRYQLYDNNRGQPWGDGDPALGPPLVIPIYGHFSEKPEVLGVIPAGQQVAPGPYTDTVTITVTVEPSLTH